MRLLRESANASASLPNADQRYIAYVKAQDFCICGRIEVVVVDYQKSCKQCSSKWRRFSADVAGNFAGDKPRTVKVQFD